MAEEDTNEISYERNEIIRHSLIPLIEDVVEDLQKIFNNAKKETTFTINTWKKCSKTDDYKIDALLHMGINNIEDHDIETLREMVQSFCDQANIAKREAALNAERNINLQKFKEINDKLGNDKKGLRKELTSTRKVANDLQAEKQKSDVERKRMEVEISNLQDRVHYAESECTSLQTKLTEALQRESQSNTSLSNARNVIDDLKAELENERIKSQAKIDKIERDGKRNYGEKEHALQNHINSLKNEITGLHEEYSQTLENHQKAAKEAIARLTKDIEDLDASRMKYYKQYKELLIDLNEHKQKISQDVLKQAILKLTNEYRNDQLKTSKIRKSLQTINLNGVTNFGERCLEVLESPQNSSESDRIFPSHRNENQQPPQPSSSSQHRYRSTSVRDTAQRYDIRGQFKSNPRH
uniref:Uncharacterized protein n=1 Tax=Panagrolaimus sp. PS1159 TaxID=55785 RepID=A0AC35G8H2_9BILA